MFVDNVEIQVKAGHGGRGLASFRREKFLPFGGPDGGDGGKGGDIFLLADDNINSLVSFKHRRVFRANNGGDGGKNRMHGTNAEDLVVRVPTGTTAYVRENERELFVADLVKDGQKVLLARGGKGGKGNIHFATSTRKAPRIFQTGEDGQQHDIILRMSLVVDVCVIGFTKSGKSTLLSALSSARPEIADYLFTTRTPVPGVVDDGVNKLTWIELPALTRGSSLGKGLGNSFLYQAERAHVIVYLLDAGSGDMSGDYEILREELMAFDSKLAEKAAIIVVNKADITGTAAIEDYVKKNLADSAMDCIIVSALDKSGLDMLVRRVHGMVLEARNRPSAEQAAEVVFRPKPVDQREKK
jgi:GTP-binding protein